VASFLVGMRYGDRRRRMWLWSLGFALVAAGAEARFVLASNMYELQQLSLPIIASYFQESLLGLPLVGLAGAAAAAVSIMLESVFSGWNLGSGVPVVRIIRVLKPAGVALAAAAFFAWALNPKYWAQEVNFRELALFSSGPFMLMGLAEGMRLGRNEWDDMSSKWSSRFRISQGLALIFLIVLATQSLVWHNLTARLVSNMDAGGNQCISTTDLKWMAQTPLDDWSITALSIFIQGREPESLVMGGSGCTTMSFKDGLPLAIFDAGHWDLRNWQSGWYNLAALGQSLTVSQETPPSCEYPFSSGWYAIEGKGADWWRWTAGTAVLRVWSAQEMPATLNGELSSLQTPNQVTISVNGMKLTTIAIAKSGLVPLPPLELSLKTGENAISFVSKNAPAAAPNDKRPLAISVHGLQLTSDDGVNICQ
jgi:hypothetical protein